MRPQQAKPVNRPANAPSPGCQVRKRLPPAIGPATEPPGMAGGCVVPRGTGFRPVNPVAQPLRSSHRTRQICLPPQEGHSSFLLDFTLRSPQPADKVKRKLGMSAWFKKGHCSTVPDYFLDSKGWICRYFPLRKRISRRHKSWMAPDSTLPTPPKASLASKTFPRRGYSSGRVITAGGPAHAADTGPTDCEPVIGCCTTWAIRCPVGRERWR